MKANTFLLSDHFKIKINISYQKALQQNVMPLSNHRQEMLEKRLAESEKSLAENKKLLAEYCKCKRNCKC